MHRASYNQDQSRNQSAISIILPTYDSKRVSELRQQQKKPYNKRKGGVYLRSPPCSCDGTPMLISPFGICFVSSKKRHAHQNSMLCSPVQVTSFAPIVVICSKSKLHFVLQAFAGGPFSQQCITNSDCDERLSVHAER